MSFSVCTGTCSSLFSVGTSRVWSALEGIWWGYALGPARSDSGWVSGQEEGVGLLRGRGGCRGWGSFQVILWLNQSEPGVGRSGLAFRVDVRSPDRRTVSGKKGVRHPSCREGWVSGCWVPSSYPFSCLILIRLRRGEAAGWCLIWEWGGDGQFYFTNILSTYV